MKPFISHSSVNKLNKRSTNLFWRTILFWIPNSRLTYSKGCIYLSQGDVVYTVAYDMENYTAKFCLVVIHEEIIDSNHLLDKRITKSGKLPNISTVNQNRFYYSICQVIHEWFVNCDNHTLYASNPFCISFLSIYLLSHKTMSNIES